jgi:hypothetical protein
MTVSARRAASAVSVLAVAATACTMSLLQLPNGRTPTQPAPIIVAPTNVPKAQTAFRAKVPQPLGNGETIALSLLDEVTGLALNQQLYPMQSNDGVVFTATLALPYRDVVKYRYVKLGSNQAPEIDAFGGPIRYRMYSVEAPGEVNDIIAGWEGSPYDGDKGSLQGRVLNADTGTPIPSILVTAGGRRAFTDSAGRFEIPGLPPGTHNLVAYALDGTYQVFQQGATVAANLNTVVDVSLKALPLVHVTFVATGPNDVQGAPIRLAGNLIELGNTFADLSGGMSAVADRMPVLAFQADGSYRATISLPAGAFVRYKYTLGDGYWNAEHAQDGSFRVRELVVPDHDVEIHDQVATWSAGSSAPILFEVTVTQNTPAADLVYIQFNPYGWTEPLPMWPLGENRWAYKLYGPIDTVGNLHYRYCRNGQCGSADDLSTAGDGAQGRSAESSLSQQDIKDSVTDWAWLQNVEPSTLVGASISPRASGFVAGVELQPYYQPNWAYFNAQAVQNVQGIGADWIVFTPGWTFKSSSPLEFGLAPEHDPFWLDSTIAVSQARAANLNVGIFPTPRFAGSSQKFWQGAPRDATWWQNWFDHYRAFLVNYADLAEQSGSQAIILGGDWLGPALPGGVLADGTASGVPSDAGSRWTAMISEVRQHFSGKLWWAMAYAPGQFSTPLNFLGSTDGMYVLWDAPLADEGPASTDSMTARAEELLDNEISPVASVLNKPVILGLAFPSASGAESGCLNDGLGGCLDWTSASQPGNPPSVNVDLQAQANMYDAILSAINTRSYVAGVISRGFYPPALLRDKSASVHGKPAADLLWYWFPRLAGTVR